MRQEKTSLFPHEIVPRFKPIVIIQRMYKQNPDNQFVFRGMHPSVFATWTTQHPFIRFDGDPEVEKEIEQIHQILKEDVHKENQVRLNFHDYVRLDLNENAPKEFRELDSQAASQKNLYLATMRQTSIMLEMQLRPEDMLSPSFQYADSLKMFLWGRKLRARAEKIAKGTQVRQAIKKMRFEEAKKTISKLDRLSLSTEKFLDLHTLMRVYEMRNLYDVEYALKLKSRLGRYEAKIVGSDHKQGVACLAEGYHFRPITWGNRIVPKEEDEHDGYNAFDVPPSSEQYKPLVGAHIAAEKLSSEPPTATLLNFEADYKTQKILGFQTSHSEMQHLMNALNEKPADLDEFAFFTLCNVDFVEDTHDPLTVVYSRHVEQNSRYSPTSVMSILNFVRSRPMLLNNLAIKKRVELILFRSLSLRTTMRDHPDYFTEYAKTLHDMLDHFQKTDPSMDT